MGKQPGNNHSKIDERSLDTMLSDLAVFTQSPTRLRILDRLSESPRTATELVDILDVHRTTLQRNLELLHEKQCIRSNPTEDIYRIAPPGELFLEALQRAMAAAQTAGQLGTFLSQFPAEAPADAACLSECCITAVTPHNPYAPQERLQRLLTASESVQLFSPHLSPKHLQIVADQITDSTSFELIFPKAVLNHFATTRSALTEAVITNGTVHEIDEAGSPSVGVGTLDETAVSVVFDDNQHVHAILEATSDQAAVDEWVRSRYRQCRRTATVIGE
ncbi:hypothetical protein HTG_04145 [Natrinema mahii]|nr:hypothetical protein HTG_04145 [Natrinema mahii]